MSRPRLLDLFCGAGGAAAGYVRAGFDVTGVDIKPQPRYLLSGASEFHQADALTFRLEGFDAIHASPPCQAYSSVTLDPSAHPDLYEPVRERLVASGLPWVIENVIGAPYRSGVVLCGSALGLEADGEWVRRHRNFEAPFLMLAPPCVHPAGRRPITITGESFPSVTRDVARHSRKGTFDLAQRLMGIDWMTRQELTQAIPPSFTAWVGERLLAALGAPGAAHGLSAVPLDLALGDGPDRADLAGPQSTVGDLVAQGGRGDPQLAALEAEHAECEPDGDGR